VKRRRPASSTPNVPYVGAVAVCPNLPVAGASTHGVWS